MEVPVFVFENLTESNVQEFMLTSPSHILDMLRDAADRLPADEDDEGWGECRRLMESHTLPGCLSKRLNFKVNVGIVNFDTG